MRLLAALAILAGCSRGTGELQLVDIKRGELVIGVVVTGELEAVDSTDIKPPAVEMWNFKIASLAPDGVDVKQGDPIVGFDPSEQARELDTMLNEAEAAKTNLAKKRDDAALARREEALQIAQAEAALRKATLKATTPGELVASVDLEAAKLDERAAQVGLELAKNRAAQQRRSEEAELASMRDKLAYATLRVEELKKAIAKMEVVAPRAGTVIYPTSWRGEKKKVGDSAWRMETVLQVVGLDHMIGRGQIDEVDIARIAKDQPVALRLDALPDVQLRGKIAVVARSVRAKSNADPSKVLEIEIVLDPSTAPLRPGMRFRGEVETARIPNTILIPAEAVFVTPAGPVAYRERDGELEPVRLELGRRSATLIEVEAGLQPGDRVSRTDPARRSP